MQQQREPVRPQVRHSKMSCGDWERREGGRQSAITKILGNREWCYDTCIPGIEQVQNKDEIHIIMANVYDPLSLMKCSSEYSSSQVQHPPSSPRTAPPPFPTNPTLSRLTCWMCSSPVQVNEQGSFRHMTKTGLSSGWDSDGYSIVSKVSSWPDDSWSARSKSILAVQYAWREGGRDQ